MNSPPSAGARTGASSPGQVSQAIARSRSGFRVERSTASLPTGTIIAPPMPCATRITTSSGSPPAAAQSAEARVNTAIAQTKTRRAP
ncbi:hypothetical protein OG202_07220 [Streptomyces sp. NBC_00310]